MPTKHTQHAEEIQQMLEALAVVDALDPTEHVTAVNVGRYHVTGPRSMRATEATIRAGETGLYWTVNTTRVQGRHQDARPDSLERIETRRRKERVDIVKAFWPVVIPLGNNYVWAYTEGDDPHDDERRWIPPAFAVEVETDPEEQP